MRSFADLYFSSNIITRSNQEGGRGAYGKEMTAQFQKYKLIGSDIWGEVDVNGKIWLKWL